MNWKGDANVGAERSEASITGPAFAALGMN